MTVDDIKVTIGAEGIQIVTAKDFELIFDWQLGSSDITLNEQLFKQIELGAK